MVDAKLKHMSFHLIPKRKRMLQLTITGIILAHFARVWTGKLTYLRAWKHYRLVKPIIIKVDIQKFIHLRLKSNLVLACCG